MSSKAPADERDNCLRGKRGEDASATWDSGYVIDRRMGDPRDKKVRVSSTAMKSVSFLQVSVAVLFELPVLRDTSFLLPERFRRIIFPAA
jgi:hypothetical protein